MDTTNQQRISFVPNFLATELLHLYFAPVFSAAKFIKVFSLCHFEVKELYRKCFGIEIMFCPISDMSK